MERTALSWPGWFPRIVLLATIIEQPHGAFETPQPAALWISPRRNRNSAIPPIFQEVATAIPSNPAIRPVVKRLLTVAVIIWLALAAAPAVPGPVRPGLDPGWMAGLHLAASNGLVAGKDIVWTYGPLGWLALPAATAGHFAAMVAFRVALWAFWVGALAILAAKTRRPAIVLLFAVAAANVIANAAFRYFLPDAQLSLAVTGAALLALSAAGAARYAHLAVLGLLSGLASVVKFNVAAEAAAVFASVTAVIMWHHNRRGMAAFWRVVPAILTLLLSSFTLYAAATGHPGSYLSYLRSAVEISSGYSEGMSFPGPDFLVWFSLGAAAILLIAIPAASHSKPALLRGWFPAFAVSFLAFKHGVVRGDIHMLPVLLHFSLAAAFLAIPAATAADRKRLAMTQLVITPLGLWMVLGVAPNGTAQLAGRLDLHTSSETASAVFDFTRALRHLVAQNRSHRTKMAVAPSLAELIAAQPVEIVPYETSYIWANHWNWRPRPVFQTYQVCTAAHDSLSAAHLAGPGASEIILFHWDPIDERHPLFVDPLSWRATFDNYDSSGREGRFLVLKRRCRPRFAPPVEFSITPAPWNRIIPVPSSSTPLLLAAEIPRSLLGQLANLFYRVDPVWIEITSQGNQVRRWRFMRANLPHGILITPYPTDIDELAQLAGPGFALRRRAIAVRFIADRPSQFAPIFQIRWLSLPLARPEGSPEAGAYASRATEHNHGPRIAIRPSPRGVGGPRGPKKKRIE